MTEGMSIFKIIFNCMSGNLDLRFKYIFVKYYAAYLFETKSNTELNKKRYDT